jgi:hypothetical protein
MTLHCASEHLGHLPYSEVFLRCGTLCLTAAELSAITSRGEIL